MLIRINDNQGPTVVQRSQLAHWGKTLLAPSVEQSRRLFRKKTGNTIQWKTFGGSRRHINCQKKKLMRRQTLAGKKEGCPGGSFEKRDRKRNWRIRTELLSFSARRRRFCTDANATPDQYSDQLHLLSIYLNSRCLMNSQNHPCSLQSSCSSGLTQG